MMAEAIGGAVLRQLLIFTLAWLHLVAMPTVAPVTAAVGALAAHFAFGCLLNGYAPLER